MYLAESLCKIANEVNEAKLVRDPSDETKLTFIEFTKKTKEIEDWLLSLEPQMKEAANKGNYWITVQHEVVKNRFEHLELFLSVLHKHGFCVNGSVKDKNQVTIAWNNWIW